MRTTHLLAMAFMALASIPLAARQTGASFQQNATVGSSVHQSAQGSATAQAKPGSASLNGSSSSSTTTSGTIASRSAASENAAANTTSAVKDGRSSAVTTSSTATRTEETSNVSGELQGKLDAKTAKVGDRVVLRTTEKVTTADGTVIPKGTKLIGHVTKAQAHDSAHAESQLGITFNRAELKSGQTLAIHSTIQSIEPRPNFAAQSSMADDNMFEGPTGGGMAGGRAMGAGRFGGGGVMGGAVDRTSIAASNAGERASSSTVDAAHAIETTAHGTEHVAGDANSSGVANVRGVANASGHLSGQASERATARSTGIPGVMLRNSDSGAASGTLSESKKNVHLDSGTQMDLSFAAGK